MLLFTLLLTSHKDLFSIPFFFYCILLQPIHTISVLLFNTLFWKAFIKGMFLFVAVLYTKSQGIKPFLLCVSWLFSFSFSFFFFARVNKKEILLRVYLFEKWRIRVLSLSFSPSLFSLSFPPFCYCFAFSVWHLQNNDSIEFYTLSFSLFLSLHTQNKTIFNFNGLFQRI